MEPNLKMSDSIKELAIALCNLQDELEPVKKDNLVQGKSFDYKYADLSQVIQTAKPLLKKNGLAVSQFVTTIDSKSCLATLLIHTSGEWISSCMPLLVATPTPQAQGSAITYARRYAYMAALGIVAEDEDDDGAAASIKPDNHEDISSETYELGKVCKHCGSDRIIIALTKPDNPRNPNRPYWKCLTCPPAKSFSHWVKNEIKEDTVSTESDNNMPFEIN